MQTGKRFKLKFLLVCALFFVPYFGAVLLYRAKPELSTINHGDLLKPSIPLADFAKVTAQPRNWQLVYFAEGEQVCDSTCQHDVAMARQVRLAFSKDFGRLHLVLLAKQLPTLSQQEHPDLVQAVSNKVMKQGLYIADPRGQLILSYGTNIQPKEVYQDLQRLLQYG